MSGGLITEQWIADDVKGSSLGQFEEYRVIWLQRLTKTTNLRQDKRSRDQDLKQGLIEYKAGLITARPCRSVCFTGRKCVKDQSCSRRHFALSARKSRWVRLAPAHPNTGKTEVRLSQVKFYLCLTKHHPWNCMRRAGMDLLILIWTLRRRKWPASRPLLPEKEPLLPVG
jgi:hypothetical protein